jgi:1-acyl-sn-glycerol-3-phosphate acyltransferase
VSGRPGRGELLGVTEPRWLWATRFTFRLLLRLGFRFRVHGLENVPMSGPVLLAGNHASFLDGPIVFIVLRRPSAFLVKSELFVGWLRWALETLRQIPIRRGKPDRTALDRSLAVLRNGGVLGMFPEGTRGSGTFESLQDGIGYLAVKAGCRVVPVVCLGTAAALPMGHHIPKLRSRLDIVFGSPFCLDVPGDARARETARLATEQIRQRLVTHLREAAAATGHASESSRAAA